MDKPNIARLFSAAMAFAAALPFFADMDTVGVGVSGA